MRNNVLVVAVVVAVLALGAVVAGTAATPSSTAQAEHDCSFPVEKTDATGTEVTLDEEPESIVVTAQSGAQIAWEFDAQDRVTGMPVGPFTAYLEGYDEKTDVTDAEGFLDVEQVVDLDPDIVIAPNATTVESVEQLRDAGLTVYHFEQASSIDAVKEKTETVGTLIGSCEEASETTEWMDERIDAVEQMVPEEDHPTVFYWLDGGFTAGEGTFQHELIETAGGQNIAAEIGIQGWQIANDEQIVEQDPERLLLQDGDEIPDNEAVQSTQAVQNDDIVYVDRNYFNQPAPRVVIALEELAEGFHDNDSADDGADDADDVTDDATDDDADETDDVVDETPDDSDDVEDDADAIPGFGVVAAVVALIGGAVMFGRRR